MPQNNLWPPLRAAEIAAASEWNQIEAKHSDRNLIQVAANNERIIVPLDERSRTFPKIPCSTVSIICPPHKHGHARPDVDRGSSWQ